MTSSTSNSNSSSLKPSQNYLQAKFEKASTDQQLSKKDFKQVIKTYLLSSKSLLIALLIIVTVESAIVWNYVFGKTKRVSDRDNLLQLNYLKNDSVSLNLIGYKNYIFAGQDSEFLQVGDSSGLYGAQPLVIEKYLFDQKFLNASCCADAAWDGHYAIAERYLRNAKKTKYLVLYVTPYAIPETVSKKFGRGYSDQLLALYSSSWRFFYHIPSLFLRKDFVEDVYRVSQLRRDLYLSIMQNFIHDYNPENKPYVNFLLENQGWLPMKRSKDEKKFLEIPRGECGEQIIEHLYDAKNQRSFLLTKALNKMKNLADRYRVKLIVLFNPVVCTSSGRITPLLAEIEEFQKKNPDVFIPFSIINTRDESYFADQYHLNPFGAENYSNEVGEALAGFLKNQKLTQ